MKPVVSLFNAYLEDGFIRGEVEEHPAFGSYDRGKLLKVSSILITGDDEFVETPNTIYEIKSWRRATKKYPKRPEDVPTEDVSNSGGWVKGPASGISSLPNPFANYEDNFVNDNDDSPSDTDTSTDSDWGGGGGSADGGGASGDW